MRFPFRKKAPRTKKKKAWREWLEAIAFALVVFLLLRFFLFDLRTVPTTSMERTIMAGDFLIVSKVHYGARIPITPLSVPLVGRTLPFGTDIPAYSTIVQLPYWRLPGFSEIQRQDLVVFNYPKDRFLPIDQRTQFVKRCVGLPGDTVRVVRKQVVTDSSPEPDNPLFQYDYLVRTNRDFDADYLKQLGITEGGKFEAHNFWKLAMTPSIADSIRQNPIVEEVFRSDDVPGAFQDYIFPYNDQFPWNTDHFGPLYIPQKGDSIELTTSNIILYGNILMHHEGQTIEYENDRFFLNGLESTHYVLQDNYYFVMGDNRDHSSDSRFWGFVPESHVIGKAVMVLFATDRSQPIWKQWQWDRFFKSLD